MRPERHANPELSRALRDQPGERTVQASEGKCQGHGGETHDENGAEPRLRQRSGEQVLECLRACNRHRGIERLNDMSDERADTGTVSGDSEHDVRSGRRHLAQ